MLAQETIDREQKFDANGKDTNGRIHVLTPGEITIPGSTEVMPYVRVKPDDGIETYYYEDKHTKTQIVLHFTMGYLHGDVAALTKPDYHVSVPFLIGRNGTIYNLFSSKYWSYHLGRNAIGGNKDQSQKTIAIELCNIGPLINHGDAGGMVTSYSQPGRPDKYCLKSQKEYYVKKSYRDWEYFATLTDAQYKSLALLLRYLTARYEIPYQFLQEPDRYMAHSLAAGFEGIVSHVNYRPDGKVDIGPAFDWNKIL